VKTTTAETLRLYAAVGLGGIIGALLREILELVVPAAHGFPIATLVINWSGSFFLAWFYTITIWRWNTPQWFRTGVGTGIVGAYTTFSTFIVETNGLLATGKQFTAVLYILLSMVGGLALAMLGSRLGGQRPEGGPAEGTTEGGAADGAADGAQASPEGGGDAT